MSDLDSVRWPEPAKLKANTDAKVECLRAALQQIATLDKRPYLTMPHGDAGYIYDLQRIAREALGVPHD